MSWRVSLPCTRAEAEAIDAAEALTIDAVLATGEVADGWRLDAYVEREPGPALIDALRALTPSAAEAAPVIERLADQDWVTLSQAGLEPIREGRFVVHTPAFPAVAPPGGRAFLIDAGRAFGTGHHETTSGCLAMLDGLAGRSFDRIVDIGTGTGLLAFAARHLWPAARIVATDIDRQAIDVTRENAGINRIDGLKLIVADGALDDRITDAAPFDLLVANVLAGPLISMAPELAAVAAPGATLILAGLLDTQLGSVVEAYAGCGCVEVAADRRGDWTILMLHAGDTRFVPAGPIDPTGRDGWALDL